MAVILKVLNSHFIVSIKRSQRNGLMELLDQYQRLEIALKLTKGRNKKAKEGGYAGGRATFGYMKQKGEKELKIHNSHAEVVKRLFELRQIHMKWSLSRLAEALNEEGYQTTQGKAFTKVQFSIFAKSVTKFLNLRYLIQANYIRYKSNTPGKESGDHAGHLAGDRVGGSPDDKLVPQSSSVDLSKYKKFENKWAKSN